MSFATWVDTNWWTFAVGIACLAALIVLERRFHGLPVPLMVVIAAILLMWLSDLEERGVEVAGTITQGLPTPMIPTVPSGDVAQLVGLAFGVFLLSYVEGIGVAKSLAGRSEKIEPGQELFANGVANIATGLFRGYSAGGSMSRSAVTSTSGARTPAAGAIVAIVLAIVLLLLTKPFSFLPEATLAAIVLVAVKHLFKYKDLQRIWKADRREAAAALATLFGVLVFGMLEGIIVGVLVTFILLLARFAKPEVSILGRRSGTPDFVDVSRNPEVEIRDDAFIFRANSGWFYANAPTIVDQLKTDVDHLEKKPSVVIIDMAPAAMIDLGAVNALDELNDELDAAGIDLELANVYAKVAEMLSDNAPGLAGVQANESIDSILAKRDRLQESPDVQEQ
ncbi:MAG: SulP family inorganic anion transporter [Thermomicrobiales bacterium]